MSSTHSMNARKCVHAQKPYTISILFSYYTIDCFYKEIRSAYTRQLTFEMEVHPWASAFLGNNLIRVPLIAVIVLTVEVGWGTPALLGPRKPCTGGVPPLANGPPFVLYPHHEPPLGVHGHQCFWSATTVVSNRTFFGVPGLKESWTY